MTRIGSSYSIINTHSAGNGASDICIAMVTARIDRLVEYCLTHSPDSPEPRGSVTGPPFPDTAAAGLP